MREGATLIPICRVPLCTLSGGKEGLVVWWFGVPGMAPFCGRLPPAA